MLEALFNEILDSIEVPGETIEHSNEPKTPPSEPSPWTALDAQRLAMHRKMRRSIDDVLLAVATINERGPAASFDDIARKARVSYATVSKLFRDDHPQREYIQSLFRVGKDARSFKVDVTKTGRAMASRIRAEGTSPRA